jgi:hypothetical protein
MLNRHTPAQAGSCSTERGAISYFAGCDLRQSVLAALRSVERLEAAIGAAFHVSATIDLEKLMEGTPEMGSRQDRRKYILGCAKSLAGKRFRPYRNREQCSRNGRVATTTVPSMTSKASFNIPESKLGERIILKRASTDIGAEMNYCPFLSLAAQTIFPPTIVVTTLTSRIFAGSIAKMSSLSRTMSASLPAVIEPFSLS